jgi:uncharacterized protein with GYD domain
MPTFLVISKHSPEDCPMFNEKARKVMTVYMNKIDALSKKYGMKMVAACGVPNEHLNVVIIEAPNLEVLQKASMEPEVMAMNAYNTIEVKQGLNREESEKMLKQIK